MKKISNVWLLIFLLVNCCGTKYSTQQGKVQPAKEVVNSQEEPKPGVVRLNNIDLSKIGHIAPMSRVQDKDYNELPIIDQLIANGKESIPYLISKLEDETKIKEPVKDYWYEVSVGDVAHFILSDFFLDYSWKKRTIPGVNWKEFPHCEDHKLPFQQCYRSYLAKYGRKTLKARWQKVWDDNKDRIYWDERDRSFTVKASTVKAS